VARGLTQAALAEKVGVSRKTINTVKKAVFMPSVGLALALAASLGLRVEDLFTLAPEAARPWETGSG